MTLGAYNNRPLLNTPLAYGPRPSSGTASNLFVDLFNNQTAAGNKTWTGSQTIQQTIATMGTETWLSLTASDDAVASVVWTSSTTSGYRSLMVASCGGSGGPGQEARFRVQTDIGSVPAYVIDGRTTADAALTNRPPLGIRNAGTTIALFTAPGGLTLSGGTAPVLSTNGGRKVKSRTALTTPVTVSDTTDYAVGSNLTVAGAVSVVLPAPATALAGATFIVTDEKGDANTNNITVSVSGGALINGAATSVLITAFASRTYMVNAAANAYVIQ